MRRIASSVLILFSLGMLPSAFAQVDTGGATVTLTSVDAGPFPDVFADSVNGAAISTLKEYGIISGYPDGTYKPASSINRAEFTKILVGSLSDVVYKEKNNCFPDVKTDAWYAKYVCAAKDKGIISGYQDGTFKPGDTIIFSEASKIIANSYGLTTATASTDKNWFQPFVASLESKKAIPLSVNYFDQQVTRDQMAEMVYRIKDNVADKASRTYKEINGEGLVDVSSCADLQQRFIDQGAYSGGYGPNVYFREAMPGTTEAAPPSAPTSPTPVSAPSVDMSGKGGGGAAEYSTTNIQVQGVDEADVIKNDGKYIYIVKGSNIRIVEAYPAETMKELVNMTLGSGTENFYPTDMYVDGDTLVVIGSYYFNYPQPLPVDSKIMAPGIMPPFYYGGGRTKVYVLNIRDRSKPVVTRAVEFDGNYTTSRKVGTTLYMVMNQNLYYPYYYSPTPVMQPEAIVPHMLDTKVGREELVSPCDKIHLLPKPQGFNYLITAAIPLADLTKNVSRSVVVGDTGTTYASKNNLYVGATDWSGGMYMPYGSNKTAIYRFALGDAQINYRAMGRVPGTLLNQFSMDEDSNMLRVATTKNEFTPGSAITNGVYVLDADMNVVGKLEGIATGEKLYSARFMGSKGYLVTFKRIDPFFVLNLADPKNPVIAGELKIPGFTNYMQPYDENHVLGFGIDTDPNIDVSLDEWLPYEAQRGMKVSLFDVTDLNNPKEMFKEVIGDRGTTSDVFHNQKALLFDKEKQILSFPVTVYSFPNQSTCSNYRYSTCPTSCLKQCVPTSCTTSGGVKVCTPDCDGANSCSADTVQYAKPTFDGAYVYTLNLSNGFQLRGKVTHYNDKDLQDLATNGYTNYAKTIQRLLYMGENLYSVSGSVVKANLLSNLVERKMIELAGEVYQIMYPL